jgi:hypothetical protein
MTHYTKNIYLVDELWIDQHQVDGVCDELIFNSEVSKQLFAKTDVTK